jgi:hypothetical protein
LSGPGYVCDLDAPDEVGGGANGWARVSVPCSGWEWEWPARMALLQAYRLALVGISSQGRKAGEYQVAHR